MKFTINGREYEPYDLSDKDLYELVKGRSDYPLNYEQKKVLSDKLLERFGRALCPKDGETRDDVFARFFSNYVNRCPNDFEKAAKAMGRDHRYLQSEMFKFCVEYMKVLAEHYDNGCYDGRNQWACKTARTLIKEYNSL